MLPAKPAASDPGLVSYPFHLTTSGRYRRRCIRMYKKRFRSDTGKCIKAKVEHLYTIRRSAVPECRTHCNLKPMARRYIANHIGRSQLASFVSARHRLPINLPAYFHNARARLLAVSENPPLCGCNPITYFPAARKSYNVLSELDDMPEIKKQRWTSRWAPSKSIQDSPFTCRSNDKTV